MSKISHRYGGQALVEGVMIRAKKAASIAVRDPSGKIQTTLHPLPAIAHSSLRRFFVVRGVIVMIEMLIVGTKALNYSTSIATFVENDKEPTKKDAIVDKVLSVVGIIIGIGLALGLFVVLPVWVSDIFENTLGWGFIYANIVEGVIRVFLLILYLYVVGLISGTKRIYRYHGAEHKTICAYENGLPLTTENIQKMPKEHPRCGTAFLITSTLLAIVIFTFLPRGDFLFVLSTRIVLIPLITGLSYEMLRIQAQKNLGILRYILIAPGVLAQKITTKEPDDDMVEVAKAALEQAIESDKLSKPL